MKLRFSKQSIQDLTAIAEYAHTHNPAAAQRVRSAILDSIQTLLQFPLVGRRQTVERVRKLVTRKYPYLVYYTVDLKTEEVVILTIQHPARQRDFTDA